MRKSRGLAAGGKLSITYTRWNTASSFAASNIATCKPPRSHFDLVGWKGRSSRVSKGEVTRLGVHVHQFPFLTSRVSNPHHPSSSERWHCRSGGSRQRGGDHGIAADKVSIVFGTDIQVSCSRESSAWQTAGRQRQSNSSSRTPQNRSSTASPNQQNPTQPPRPQPGQAAPPPNNVWTQRNSGTGPSNGQPAPLRVGDASRADSDQSVNGFNAAHVKTFLGRDAGLAAYKPEEEPGSSRASGGAWGAKRERYSNDRKSTVTLTNIIIANHMANNQPFFTQLAKQIATLEGGG
jgi:hypothetical protein